MWSKTRYHLYLHAVTLCAAFALVALQFLDETRIGPSYRDVDLLVANVIGVAASVEPNEFNTVTAELTRQKSQLDARERELREREATLADDGRPRVTDFLITGALLMLLSLIVLNYIFDYVRARGRRILEHAEAT